MIRAFTLRNRMETQRSSEWLAERDEMIKRAKEMADAEERLVPRLDPAKDPWPPVWKPIKESPQFIYGLIDSFVDPWDLENFDYIPDSNFPPNRRGYKSQNIHKNVKGFLNQIRESRGYDIDYDVPEFVRSPFQARHDFHSLEKKNPKYYGKMMEVMKFAFEEINVHAEMNGERYELLGMEKLVEASQDRTRLITFSVKEVAPNVGAVKSIQAMVFCEFSFRGDRFRLMEWRFKPEATSTETETETSEACCSPGTSGSSGEETSE